MMSTLFIREHNAIADALKSVYPQWTDEELYQRARLVTAGLVAKIHTVEWTPAIIAHPTTVTAMSANWWGVAGERIHQLFGRISSSEILSGIPGSAQDNFGVPYSLTEEFSIVYRMHPLIPDDYTFRRSADDQVISEHTFPEIAGPHAQEVAGAHRHGRHHLQLRHRPSRRARPEQLTRASCSSSSGQITTG